MHNKHILMVSHDFLPNIGGVAVYVYELSKALLARGHQLTVLTQYASFSTQTKEEMVDGIRVIDIISQETGILVPPKSAQALQEAMTYCIQEVDERHQMGRHSREHVEQALNWRQLAQQVDTIYDTAKR
ncbi:glycosyltransferase [Listeria booriae]|uniref:glycosyltransferase n=1 Tax=Listeria booriae TaxID=1552123 RepID=UPI001626550C|nr:glycosyltransferase [Listeria booriae]MBC2188404.1 glycosyltransferase [Listeria booriae]